MALLDQEPGRLLKELGGTASLMAKVPDLRPRLGKRRSARLNVSAETDSDFQPQDYYRSESKYDVFNLPKF